MLVWRIFVIVELQRSFSIDFGKFLLLILNVCTFIAGG